MQEAWETARHEWLIWIATRPGVASDAQLRKFAVWSSRKVQYLMTDPSSIEALNIAERFSEGDATDSELAAARDAAGDAAWSAALDAARAAAWAAADAARAAAWSAQDAWLRKNITPNFE